MLSTPRGVDLIEGNDLIRKVQCIDLMEGKDLIKLQSDGEECSLMDGRMHYPVG